MGEPSTEAGRALRALLNEADIHWPDDMTRLASDVLTPTLLALEAEARRDALAEVRAAVEGLTSPPRYENDRNGNRWTTDMEYGWDMCTEDVLAALLTPVPKRR